MLLLFVKLVLKYQLTYDHGSLQRKILKTFFIIVYKNVQPQNKTKHDEN